MLWQTSSAPLKRNKHLFLTPRLAGEFFPHPVVCFRNKRNSSPTNIQFQQTTAHNPFIQRQMTGAFPQTLGGPVLMQSTGFPTSFPFQAAQPFQPTQPSPSSQTSNFIMESHQVPQHRPFSTFVPQQATGLQPGPTGFLQPQPTGANPFRQSMLAPQTTGMLAFNSNGIAPMPPLPPLPASQAESHFQSTNNLQSRLPEQPTAQPVEVPARPASTPLTNIRANLSSASPPIAQPVKSHQTGSRNPFGVPVTPAPPIPKPPTLAELSMGFGRPGIDGSQPTSQLQSTIASSSPVHNTTTTTTGSILSTVASSFAFSSTLEENPPSLTSGFGLHSNSQTAPPNTNSNASDSLFSSLSSQATISTAPPHDPSIPVTGPIKSQPTGFGGVKPFKPTSSFGASLLESLPPIPQSGTTTPDPSAQTTMHSSTPYLPTNLTLNGFVHASNAGKDSNVLGTINPQPTGVAFPSQWSNGSTLGVGLRPQATGALGAANPFRATMFTATSAPPSASVVPGAFASSASTPPFGGLSNRTGGPPMFSSGFGTGAFGPSFAHVGQDNSNIQQQNVGATLI